MKDSFFAECEKIVGPAQLDTSLDPPKVIPPTEELLCDVVRLAAREKRKIRVIGGGTFPVSPNTAGPVLVSIEMLSGVSEVNPADFVVVASAGAIVDNVVDKARDMKLHLPLDITSGSEATIGGAYMTGAAGPSRAGYGSFGKYVIGVRCVSAQGNVVRFGGRTAKNVTGYDLTWFLNGTMGLYAIVTELTIKALPLPEIRTVAVAGYRPGSAPFKTVLSGIINIKHVTSLEIAAPEGLGGEITIGVGMEGMRALVERSIDTCRNVLDVPGTIECCEEEPENFFRGFRRSILGRFHDFLAVSIPPAASATLLEKLYSLSPEAPVIAHPLLGRFHVACRDESIRAALEKLSLSVGGKIPFFWRNMAENGISGLFSEGERGIAASLKRELDPDCLLNPHLNPE